MLYFGGKYIKVGLHCEGEIPVVETYVEFEELNINFFK
jgi:hypothetical protein